MSTYNDTYSITDLRQRALEVLAATHTQGYVNIIQNSQKAGVLVDADYFTMLKDAYEDYEDQLLIDAHINDPRMRWEEFQKELAAK